MAVLPGAVEVIVRVNPTAVVANPAIAVEVGRIGVAGLVGVMPAFVRLW
jgi:hypothetical protein